VRLEVKNALVEVTQEPSETRHELSAQIHDLEMKMVDTFIAAIGERLDEHEGRIATLAQAARSNSRRRPSIRGI
jgi:hypothetical protein